MLELSKAEGQPLPQVKLVRLRIKTGIILPDRLQGITLPHSSMLGIDAGAPSRGLCRGDTDERLPFLRANQGHRWGDCVLAILTDQGVWCI